MKARDLKENPKNPRTITEERVRLLGKNLSEYGDLSGVVFNRTTGQLVSGHQRNKNFDGDTEIVITKHFEKPTRTGTVAMGYLKHAGERFSYREVAWPEKKELAANLIANKNAGQWDPLKLSEVLSQLTIDSGFNVDLLTMFDPAELALYLGTSEEAAPAADAESEEEAFVAGTLAVAFGAPPFSVLDTRQGYWKDRKNEWLRLGIRSELGRGENSAPGGSKMCAAKMKDGKFQRADLHAGLLHKGESREPGTYEGGTAWLGSGSSIFDPVLCEILYRWFTPPAAVVVDPFAGGSVRGIIAGYLGKKYYGVDLRQEQVDANKEQLDLCETTKPVWHCGDSRNILRLLKGVEADFIFSCPPYADLEVYSDDPKDLSTLAYSEFLEAYRKIIAHCFQLLKNDRFACFVVGEVRSKKGGVYYNFVADTIQAFLDAGFEFYNEAILLTSLGSLPVRVGRMFSTSRKLGKTHQNVLVFIKGDAKKATLACGEVELACELAGIGGDEQIEDYGEILRS